MSDVFNQKNLQRKAGMNARKSLNKDTAANFSRIISEKLISCSYASVHTIFSYQPFGGEVDISYFNEWAAQEGKRIAYPVCHIEGKMNAVLPNDIAAWEIGKYGIKTPIESQSVVLSPTDIELIIVPCTAFHGNRKMRIGMGAGYYDRFLPQCSKAITIAVAYEAQQIHNLYVDEWDLPLDYIVTEKHWY